MPCLLLRSQEQKGPGRPGVQLEMHLAQTLLLSTRFQVWPESELHVYNEDRQIDRHTPSRDNKKTMHPSAGALPSTVSPSPGGFLE